MLSDGIGNDYLGKLDNLASIHAVIKEGLTNTQTNYRPMIFIYNKLKCFPCKMDVDFENDDYYLPFEKLMKIFKEFGHKSDFDLRCNDMSGKRIYEKSVICELKDSIFVHLQHGYFEDNVDPNKRIHSCSTITVYYLPKYKQSVNELVDKFTSVKVKRAEDVCIYLIGYDWDYDEYDDPMKILDLIPIEINDPKITDLKLHYGEELLNTHKTIMNGLANKDGPSGLILLHGEAGSGKSHYIRYLIHNLRESEFVYLPCDMVEKLSDPELFSFLADHLNKILIIEDAENIIKKRTDEGSKSQAVANLLNLCDGLLGDALHYSVIATFNCELGSIDSALLRKGRLIGMHEFKKLNVDNAQKLSNELGFTSTITEPMTLADIYCQNQK